MGLTGPEGILSSTSMSASGTRSPHPLRGDKERERERERESHSAGSSFFSGSGSKNSLSGMHCSTVPCPNCSALLWIVLLCLPYPALSCYDLSCPVLSCPVLSCPVLSCPVLSCPALLTTYSSPYSHQYVFPYCDLD
jgi:hypothetical protein